MRLFYLATKPVVDTLNWMGNAVLKPFGIPPASEAGHAPHTERELRTLIEQSERAGILDPAERTFTEGVFSFGDRRARAVMVPRRQVRALRSDQPVEEAARVAVSSGHIRLPLCDETGDLDSATQVVHTLALLDERRPDGTVRVAGEARLEAVGRELGLDVGEHREATFGGYLVGLSGRVPDCGEVLDLGRWQATVDEQDDGIIGSLTLRQSERHAPTPDPGAAGE